MDNAEFLVKVMRIAAKYDSYSDLFWTVDSAGPFFHSDDDGSSPLRVFINCNDLFFWACADAEEITPDNIGEWERALQDDHIWGSNVFVCRVRKMRPQPPCYKGVPEKIAALYDAAGPPRDPKDCG